MGMSGDAHCGDPWNLCYVNKDLRNGRFRMRRDMYIKIEYFQKRQAENPNFFYATQLDVDNAMRTLFWVDGRTQLLLFGKHATQKKTFTSYE
jgi:hypothetical protein